jgi:D-alanyl-D-alanine carboxypeptidase
VVIRDRAVRNLIVTEIPTIDPDPSNYYFGISSQSYHGLKAFGHSGFWGSKVMYFPDLNTSVAVFVLVKEFGNLRDEVINQVVDLLDE